MERLLKLSFRCGSLLIATILPVVSGAQVALEDSNFRSFVVEVLKIVAVIIPILFIIAIVVFFWAMAKIVLNSSNAVERQNARNYILWAIVALFALFAFNGIIRFFVGEFGFDVFSIEDLLLPSAP